MFAALGPYTCPQLREIAAHIAAEHAAFSLPRIIPAAQLGDEDEAHLFAGTPYILLWRATPEYGHFIALVPRAAGTRMALELFDPVGGEGVERYLVPAGQIAKALNTDKLAGIFQRWTAAGGLAEYNVEGPQDRTTESCGLWCLLRVLHRHLQPAKFSRKFR